jgi:taurine transport system substrate-binding protein
MGRAPTSLSLDKTGKMCHNGVTVTGVTVTGVTVKKSFIIVVSAALLLTVLSGCSKKQESGKSADLPSKVTIGIQVGIMPNAIAIGEGWLTEIMGVEVDIVNFDAGRDIIAAMAAGTIDIGQVGTVPASLAVVNGIPCQVFYLQGVMGEVESLIVRNNLGVQDAQGLIGRKIAATFSSTSHYSLMKYLELNKVNPSDVDIIDMRTGDMLEAFLKGNIDGAFTWEPNVTQMKNNGGVMLTSARELADRGYATIDLDIVRTEFAEKYPDLMSTYVRTMDRAVALYRNDPKAAGAALARHTGLTAEECLAMATGSIWLTVNEQKGMRWAGSSALGNIMLSTAQFLYEQGNIPQEPSIEVFQRAVTNRYLVPYSGK